MDAEALLSPSSAVVRAFLAKRTSSFASDNDDFDDEETTLIAREFDGVTVRCSIPKGDKFATKKALISLAFPKLSQQTTTQQSRRRQEREDVCKATLMETYGAMRAVTAVRVLTFLGGEEEDDAPEFGCDVTVEVDLKRLAALNDDDDEKEENIEAISKVRMYAGYGTLRECLKRVSRTEREDNEDEDDWVPALRRQFVAPAVSMYCRVEEDESLKDAEEGRSCTVVIPMHISSSVSNNEDEVVIARAFLAHFAEASRSSARLSAAPFVNYHKPGNKPPLELTTTTKTKTKTNNNNDDDENGICDDDEVDEMDLNANGGYISFVLFPRHVKTKESLERAVWLLASFPNFIKSHLKCSKAYWHGKMRGKAEELLETLKRAQKEPKASPKKKLMSGRTYVPR